MASLSGILQLAEYDRQRRQAPMQSMISGLAGLAGGIAQKQRQQQLTEQSQKTIADVMGAGQHDIEYAFDEFGQAKRKLKPKKPVKRDEGLRKQLVKYQELAAKEGIQLNIDTNQPLQTQVRTARKIYAERPLKPKINREEYNRNLQTAVRAIQVGKNPIQVFQKISTAYPSKSAELQRILLARKKPSFEEMVTSLSQMLSK